jgi:plasmid stabilization system protein ParE
LTEQPVSLLPEALEEALAATEWYAKRSARAAQLFLDEIDRTIDRLGANPAQFPSVFRGTRQAKLRKFPWSLVFRETSDGIEVIAFAHSRRRPGYWRGRN